jgi:uncharacterized membrane protein
MMTLMNSTQAMGVVTLASLLASALSASIAARTAAGAGLPGCGAESGCAAIASSRWARWGPIPVSIAGTVLYLVLGVLTVVILFGRFQERRGQVSELALTLALSAAGAGVWFVLLQLVVIRRGCLYCNLVHGLGWIVLALLLGAQTTGGGVWPQRATCMAGCALGCLSWDNSSGGPEVTPFTRFPPRVV